MFRKGSEETAASAVSKLERYFNRPPDARFDNVKYLEYYETFMVIKKKPGNSFVIGENLWKDYISHNSKSWYVYRRKTEHVARMQLKRPSTGDVFFLRLILNHRPVRSYADARTVDGIIYLSFGEAALSLSLVSHENEGEICMREAVANLQSPAQLRSLFVLLITEGSPANILFQEYETVMADDFVKVEGMDIVAAKNASLLEITKKIEAIAKRNSDFGLPNAISTTTEVLRYFQQFNRERRKIEYEATANRLNTEQKEFLSRMEILLRNETGGLIFLNGPAGRGKTFVSVALVNFVRMHGGIALCCASSGIAATHYPGGRTAHNLFKIPVKENPLDLSEIQCDIAFDSQRADLLRQAKLVIWDEFPMSHKSNFEAVDRMLRQLRRDNTPCGKLLFICAGDFRQIPPVVEYGSRKDTVKASIRSSPLWEFFVVENLTVPVRQSEDLAYADFVDKIGNDTMEKDIDGCVELNLIERTNNVQTLIDFVYPRLRAEGIASTRF